MVSLMNSEQQQSVLALLRDFCAISSIPGSSCPLMQNRSKRVKCFFELFFQPYHFWGSTSFQFIHSVMSNSATPWTAVHQASLSITNFQSLLKLMSIELVMPSNHFILCYPLLLPLSVFPSIRDFSNESVLCIRRTK